MFSTEEERHVRANDRPFNLSYHYAVSTRTKNCSSTAALLLVCMIIILSSALEQCHQDFQVQHLHLPPTQPV